MISPVAIARTVPIATFWELGSRGTFADVRLHQTRQKIIENRRKHQISLDTCLTRVGDEAHQKSLSEGETKVRQPTVVRERSLGTSSKLARRDNWRTTLSFPVDHTWNEARVPATFCTNAAAEDVVGVRFRRSHRSSSPAWASGTVTRETREGEETRQGGWLSHKRRDDHRERRMGWDVLLVH